MLTVDPTNPLNEGILALDTGYVLKSTEYMRKDSRTHFAVFQVGRLVHRDENHLSIYCHRAEENPAELARQIRESQMGSTKTKFYDRLSFNKPSWLPDIDLSHRRIIITVQEMNQDEKQIFLDTLVGSLRP